jgi:hypothetical protein
LAKRCGRVLRKRKESKARRIQEQAFQDVAYVPTGRWRDLMAYRRNVTSMLSRMLLFSNLTMG